MTVLYAESSAVLTWLLGEPGQAAIIDALSGADDVVTSALTRLECARGLHRARLARRITTADESAALHLLDETVDGWQIVELTEDVLAASRRHFPREPVRTLDAIHLASAQLLLNALGTVDVLSLDDRVRNNAAALRMHVVPAP